MHIKRGYFLDQPLDMFDAGFFGISGKEADAMDPQQRLLLEVTYEALENAGITMKEISGTKTAVYCGSLNNDYLWLGTDLAYYPRHTVTGTGNSILANRVSFFYNLKGPSLQVDTACSSSLSCFHLGNQSIITGESDYAIILGCMLNHNPSFNVTITDMGFLAADGRCRSFDKDGSGYARGEGICAVVLKRRSNAVREGTRIQAVVRATGSNHDGKKTGLTVPSSDAQESLIRSTYSKAGLNPDDTQYFEVSRLFTVGTSSLILIRHMVLGPRSVTLKKQKLSARSLEQPQEQSHCILVALRAILGTSRVFDAPSSFSSFN